MKPIRIMIADDHTLVRAGTLALLEKTETVEIVAEAGEGYEALRLIREKRPDLVLMDISMPGLNGLEVAARALEEFPGLAIIILTMHKNEEYVIQAFRIGVSGYLLKDAEAEELELAVRSVNRGETYLSPAISKQVMGDYLALLGGKKEGVQSAAGIYDRLTAREREVLQLIAEGYRTREIAAKLFISVKTVEAHRTHLMKRLDIHETASLVRYAIREGVASPG